jgi:hypothetical protein
MSTTRRDFLKILGAGAAGALFANPLLRAFADPGAMANEFFILIHAAGGWDVTLWSDPRNEQKGLITPASTATVTTQGVTGWVDAPFADGATTFKPLVKGNYVLGPAMGSLADLYDRWTLINGISMNTVSHPDGTYFSSTGRHLAGGRPVGPSIDTMLANELGQEQLLPSLSVNFPSTYIELNAPLDPRVIPLRVSDVTAVSKSLNRSALYDDPSERAAVAAVLSDEAADLARRAFRPDVPEGLSLQYAGAQKLLGPDVQTLFNAAALRTAHPGFDYAGKFQGNNVVNAAFAVEAIKRRLVRCASFAMASVDTHNTNYRNHPLMLQETFEMLATLIHELDNTTFDGSSDRLSDHTHILVLSEFCRTPQINLNQGRDHYPNNSALVISPRFKTNFTYGKSDPDQLLPLDSGTFSDGTRAITPPDLLATFLGAFAVDPRKYLRDGEIVKDLLR